MIETSSEQANEIALKQQFLDRAKALSKQPEVFRCQLVTQLICDTVAFGVRAEAEIFEAVYGDPSGRKYWDAHLSEAISAYSFAHLLSAHLTVKAEQLEMARIAIIRSFRDAAEAGERWFTGDTSPLLAMEYGQTNFEKLGKIKVHPRAAVEWLLSKPKREYFVPDSLRRFLQSSGEATGAKAMTKTRPLPRKKLSGPIRTLPTCSAERAKTRTNGRVPLPKPNHPSGRSRKELRKQLKSFGLMAFRKGSVPRTGIGQLSSGLRTRVTRFQQTRSA